jgi:FdrA protein
LLQVLDLQKSEKGQPTQSRIDLPDLNRPMAAINVGLESFTSSLKSQDAAVVQVDWRPPAGGNEKLMDILERMKTK